MPNKNYQKGARKERQIVNEARAKGLLAWRSAGSKTPCDVTIVDVQNKEIRLIQSKNKKYISPKEKRGYEEFLALGGTYKVETEIK